jgi:hypothetical protein
MDPSRQERPDSPSPRRGARSSRGRDTVEIPRLWLVGLAGALVVALLLVAYLVGRESGRRADETARNRPAAAPMEYEPSEYADDDEGWEEEAPFPEDTAPTESDSSPGSWPPGDGSLDTEPPAPAWPAAAPPSSAPDPQATSVAAYFTEIEALERQAKYWSNPQELAMSLVGQGAQGDTSGMRQLLETQRSAQRQIEAMSVPSPCREHHRRTVEVMGRALELLETLESGMASGNLEGLMALTGEARQLEADTRQVDALATQLKREYGL